MASRLINILAGIYFSSGLICITLVLILYACEQIERVRHNDYVKLARDIAESGVLVSGSVTLIFALLYNWMDCWTSTSAGEYEEIEDQRRNEAEKIGLCRCRSVCPHCYGIRKFQEEPKSN